MQTRYSEDIGGKAAVYINSPKAVAGRYYRPELDVLRLVAFLFVFVYHTVPSVSDPRVTSALRGFAPLFFGVVMAGRFGLSLFFTLSAFLICELLVRERDSAGTVDVKQFYIRRILRVWPLYYLGIGIGIAAALLPGGSHSDLAQMGWFAIFMGAGFNFVFGVTSPMGQLWSISVEEQFYLFAPWIVKRFDRRVLYGFSLALILVANCYLFYLGKISADNNLIWTNSLVQFECFGAGIVLSLSLGGRLPEIPIWQRLALVAASWACWFYAGYGIHFDFSSKNPGSWSLILGYALSAAGSSLLLVAFLGVSSRLIPAWAVYLGRISYGLYVFHLLAVYITKNLLIGSVRSLTGPVYLFKGALALGLTILFAALSNRFFETPFLKLKRRHAIIQSQPVELEAGRRSPHDEPAHGGEVMIESNPSNIQCVSAVD